MHGSPAGKEQRDELELLFAGCLEDGKQAALVAVSAPVCVKVWEHGELLEEVRQCWGAPPCCFPENRKQRGGPKLITRGQ